MFPARIHLRCRLNNVEHLLALPKTPTSSPSGNRRHPDPEVRIFSLPLPHRPATSSSAPFLPHDNLLFDDTPQKYGYQGRRYVPTITYVPNLFSLCFLLQFLNQLIHAIFRQVFVECIFRTDLQDRAKPTRSHTLYTSPGK